MGCGGFGEVGGSVDCILFVNNNTKMENNVGAFEKFGQ